MTTDVKYDFEPYDGKPGESYDRFERRLMNAGSKTDDRGYSYESSCDAHGSVLQHGARVGKCICQDTPAGARKAQSVRLLSRKQRQHVRCTWVMRYACGVCALWACSTGMAQWC